MRRSNLAVAVVGALLFIGSAFAAKQCQEGEDVFPGVDPGGNLEGGELSGVVQCRECLNTKNGKFSVKCSGDVGNDSGENQKYKNAPEFIGFTKSVYKVKSSGAAKFTGKGVGID